MTRFRPVLAVKSGCITVKQQTILRNRYQGNDVLEEPPLGDRNSTRNEIFRILIFRLASIRNNSPRLFLTVKEKMHWETHTAIYTEIPLKRDETISKDAHLFGSLQDSFK